VHARRGAVVQRDRALGAILGAGFLVGDSSRPAAGDLSARHSGIGGKSGRTASAALATRHHSTGLLGTHFSNPIPGSHETQLVLLIVLLGVVILMLGTLSAFLYAYFTR